MDDSMPPAGPDMVSPGDHRTMLAAAGITLDHFHAAIRELAPGPADLYLVDRYLSAAERSSLQANLAAHQGCEPSSSDTSRVLAWAAKVRAAHAMVNLMVSWQMGVDVRDGRIEFPGLITAHASAPGEAAP